MVKNKKAALELSIGTIVVLVLGIIMLVFGIILVRSIMCAGIIMTEDLSGGIQDEIRGLFAGDQYGVKCLGEDNQEVNLGSGGRRKVICILKTEDSATYKLSVTDVRRLKGASDSEIKSWILDRDWTGSVSPGGEGKTETVLLLDIPRDAPTTTLKITMDAIKNNDPSSKNTHTSYINIVPVGFFKTTMC